MCKVVAATYLGGVEGRLQGDADGASEVYAADDRQHDPLVPGKAPGRPFDSHRVRLQEPRLPASYILLQVSTCLELMWPARRRH